MPGDRKTFNFVNELWLNNKNPYRNLSSQSKEFNNKIKENLKSVPNNYDFEKEYQGYSDDHNYLKGFHLI